MIENGAARVRFLIIYSVRWVLEGECFYVVAGCDGFSSQLARELDRGWVETGMGR